MVIISDMEGASGIFESDQKLLKHGSDEWSRIGRKYMTSDLLAVCEAVNEFGVDEIFYYDSHYAGNSEPNVIVDLLPDNLVMADVEDRCFYWRRIRGQAEINPIGLITIGQHARNGEEHAYFAHTIQSPPIKEERLNGIHIAEIGFSVLNFHDIPYVANVGCAASEKEARELNPNITHVSCKSKKDNWEPSTDVTYPIIKEGIINALSDLENKMKTIIDGPYRFEMKLMEGYYFDQTKSISWKGTVENETATWESPDVEIGLELFNYVRELIRQS